jgi:hypothetical protein
VCGMEELVEAALDGYTVTVFAFGQTGSGKTYTIVGPRLAASGSSGDMAAARPIGAACEDDGLLTRCMAHAFRSARACA